MPLSTSRYPMIVEFKRAFADALAAGKEDGADADAINDALARDLAIAVHDYVISAVVITTVAPGQLCITAGSPTAHVGATVAPGSGNGNLV